MMMMMGRMWGWKHHPRRGRRHLQPPVRCHSYPPQEGQCKAQGIPRECSVCPARQGCEGYAYQGII